MQFCAFLQDIKTNSKCDLANFDKTVDFQVRNYDDEGRQEESL